MDLSKLSKGERIVAGTGVVLFILSFIGSWVKVEAGGSSVTGNAWDGYGFLLKLGLILSLVAALAALSKLAGVSMTLPPTIYVGLAGVATLLVLLTVLIGPDDEGADLFGVEVSRGIFLFIGLILAAAQTYGGYLHMQEPAGAGGPAAAGPAPTPPPAG